MIVATRSATVRNGSWLLPEPEAPLCNLSTRNSGVSWRLIPLSFSGQRCPMPHTFPLLPKQGEADLLVGAGSRRCATGTADSGWIVADPDAERRGDAGHCPGSA